MADSWTKKTWGSPGAGWPAFCSGCGRREDLCVAHGGCGADRTQKGRSMEQDPKPRPV